MISNTCILICDRIKLWLLTARKICSASNFTRSAGNQDTHFTTFFADYDPFSFQSLIKFIFYVNTGPQCLYTKQNKMYLLSLLEFNSKGFFQSYECPLIILQFIYYVRIEDVVVSNILHLGTTFPSLFSKHNITTATTLISLCHAWRSAVSFLSKCIVRDIHNIHTFFNIFNHVKSFSGGKSSHRHVILLGSRCGQRIN